MWNEVYQWKSMIWRKIINVEYKFKNLHQDKLPNLSEIHVYYD